MTSRLLVQVAAILAMALVVLVAAGIFERVSMSAGAYLLTFTAVIVSSALFSWASAKRWPAWSSPPTL